MERVACYIRVSTAEQKLHGISLDAQRDKLQQYADQHGLTIAGWYEDEGVSGRKLIRKRPALQQMLHDAQAGKFDRILFIKLDRFFRSVAEYHECMKLIDPVVWTATEEKYDLTTANGRAFVNMKLTIAELEADQTSERIRLVNDFKVNTGQAVTGSICWSHKIVKTENGKRIIVNPETRDDAIKVIEYYLKTNSLRKTMEYSEQFHPFYDLKGLKRWLSNPMLCGAYRHNENYCEPLIDRELFDKLQYKLAHNIRYDPVGDPIFRKLLICPVCGRRLTATTSVTPIKGKRYRYEKYRCDSFLRNRCTFKKKLSEAVVERLLLDNLEGELSKLSAEVASAKSQQIDIKKYEDELDRVNYMFEKNRISISEYDRKYSELQDKIRTARQLNSESPEQGLEKISGLLSSGWRETYASLSPENKSNFWHSILKSATIEKDGRKYTLLDIEFIC